MLFPNAYAINCCAWAVAGGEVNAKPVIVLAANHWSQNPPCRPTDRGVLCQDFALIAFICAAFLRMPAGTCSFQVSKQSMLSLSARRRRLLGTDRRRFAGCLVSLKRTKIGRFHADETSVRGASQRSRGNGDRCMIAQSIKPREFKINCAGLRVIGCSRSPHSAHPPL